MKKIKLLIIFCFCIYPLAGITQIFDPKLLPMPMELDVYQVARKKLESQQISSEDIILLGDSITALGNWGTLLGNVHVRNWGIGSDIAKGIQLRLKPIVEGKPKKVFLMIGINDLGILKYSVTEVIDVVENIVQDITVQSPNTALYLISILPVNYDFPLIQAGDLKSAQENFTEYNQKLSGLAQKYHATYINAHDSLLSEDKKQLDKSYTVDGIHLNSLGYEKLTTVLRSYILN